MKPAIRATDAMIAAVMEKREYDTAYVMLCEICEEDGLLSTDNRRRVCECLYFMRRYTTALENATKFLNDSPESKELMFIIGMCHFQLRDFEKALGVFSTDERWSRWADKARLVGKRDTLISVGSTLAANADDNARFSFKDLTTAVETRIPLEGLREKCLDVSMGNDWFDLSYDDGLRQISRSVELYAACKPDTLVVTVTPMDVLLTFDKLQAEAWPTLSRPPPAAINPRLVENSEAVVGQGDVISDDDVCDAFRAVMSQVLVKRPEIFRLFE